MFRDFRDDDTQKLFSKALNCFGDLSCHGFRNNGTIVLTSDYKLLEILATKEQQEINNNTPRNKKREKIEMLNFGNFSLNKDQKLSTSYSNALFFREATYTNGYDYGAGEIGGENTLILADSPAKLKKYIGVVFKKHLSDFHIDLNNRSWFEDPTEA